MVAVAVGDAAAARLALVPSQQPSAGIALHSPPPDVGQPPSSQPPSPPSPRRGEGEGGPPDELLQSAVTRFPVYLGEGEEGRETLLSVAIVNPNNNNKEKSLQLGAG